MGTLFVPIFISIGGVTIANLNYVTNQLTKKKENEELVNENIRFKEMLVIGSDGSKDGVITRSEALRAAQELELDLVVVSPDSKPPVAKIMDYKKFKYDQKKKQKEAKKNQKVTIVKEIQLSPVIDKHDLETKANLTRKFIEKDNRVKVSLRFRGRMIAHQDLGFKVMQDFIDNLADVAQVDSQPKLDGKLLFMTLAPKKDK
jgi:translation initiation factor IF-3